MTEYRQKRRASYCPTPLWWLKLWKRAPMVRQLWLWGWMREGHRSNRHPLDGSAVMFFEDAQSSIRHLIIHQLCISIIEFPYLSFFSITGCSSWPADYALPTVCLWFQNGAGYLHLQSVTTEQSRLNPGYLQFRDLCGDSWLSWIPDGFSDHWMIWKTNLEQDTPSTGLMQ